MSSDFAHFAQDWEFLHNTSSPYHSRSNGKVEAAVKIAKGLLKKARQSGGDVWKKMEIGETLRQKLRISHPFSVVCLGERALSCPLLKICYNLSCGEVKTEMAKSKALS